MNKFFKWTFIVLSLGGLTYLGYLAYGLFSFANSPNSSKKNLIENFERKSQEIYEVKNYIKTITSNNNEVDIEFEDNNTLSIFHVKTNDNYVSNWDLNLSSPKTDSLLNLLGWTRETLLLLKDKLDKANCISVESGEPCTIGYQRSGMGMYFYKIFDKSLNDSMQKEFNDGCTYIYYKDNIVLEYGGGAVGPQCFEDFKRVQ